MHRGAGATDAARPASARARRRVRRQLARLPPVRGARTPSIASASRRSPTSCGRRCSRSPCASSIDVIADEPVGPRPALRRVHLREPGRSPSTTACRRRPGRADAGSRVDDAEPLRPRRPAADGRVPDQERTRPAHEPGEARQLGGEARARRAHLAAAADGAGSCRRTKRSWTCRCARRWSAIAPTRSAPPATPSSTRSGLVFEGFGPVGERRQQRPRRPRRRRLGDVPRREPGQRRRRAAHATSAVIASATSSTTSARKLLAYALGRSFLLTDQPLVDEMQPPQLARHRLSLRHLRREHRHEPPVPHHARIRHTRSTIMSQPQSRRADRLLPSHRSSAASASRWRCRGWNRSRLRLDRSDGRSGRARELAGAPKRFAVLFMGNGINPNHWWAKGSGAAMELSKTLEPLEPLKHEDQRHRRAVQQVRDRQGHPSRA